MNKNAFIAANIADLWSLPEFNSERVNQALFGDKVRILRKESGFAEVELSDGYHGWVDIQFLGPGSNRTGTPNYQITAKQAKVIDSSGRPMPPYQLYYGTQVVGRKTKNSRIRISIPGDSSLYLNSRQLTPIISNMKTAATASKLCREARKFLGVPYLWGGKSPLGFDCSGFMQAIFARFGIQLPRDTKDQIACGECIERAQTRPGDLLFFDRHVALALSRTDYIHSSVGGSGVAINSFVKTNRHFREDLNRDFAQTRRIR